MGHGRAPISLDSIPQVFPFVKGYFDFFLDKNEHTAQLISMLQFRKRFSIMGKENFYEKELTSNHCDYSVCQPLPCCDAGFSTFAEETEQKEKLTEQSELWMPKTVQEKLSYKRDLSLEEFQIAKLSPEDTPEIVSSESTEEKEHVNRLWEQGENLY